MEQTATRDFLFNVSVTLLDGTTHRDSIKLACTDSEGMLEAARYHALSLMKRRFPLQVETGYSTHGGPCS